MPEERREIQAAELVTVTLVLLVLQALLDLPDRLLPMTDSEAMMIIPGIIQVLKERKEIVDLQGVLKFQVTGRPLTFTR